MIRQAFLFMVKKPNNEETFFVKIARYVDYRVGEVEWMDDVNLPQWDDATGTGTLVPDIDLTEECYEFATEQKAMLFIAQHYMAEYEKNITNDLK